MEITGIKSLMMWRGGAKQAEVTAERLTDILKTLTAEMYPSIPQHDLMIRAGSEGNGALFSPSTL